MSSLPAALTTPRLELRRWTVDDIDPMMAALETSIDSLQPWMPWASDGVPARDVELAACEAAVIDFDRDADWQFLLFETSNQALVGSCGLHRTAVSDGVEIGYWVRSDRHGRGYATEAATALLDAAFTSLDWVDEVQVRMDRANVASARVPEKVGFRLAGEEDRPILTSGHTGRGLVWSLDRKTWQSRGGQRSEP